MNKDEFDAAMRGAELKERDQWVQDMDKTQAMPVAQEEEGPTMFAKILALFFAAATIPAIVHALYFIARWSWNLIG